MPSPGTKDVSHPDGSGAGAESKNLVGPVVRSGELADAVAEAARLDNPGREVVVEDHCAYLRIKVEHECLLRRATIAEQLGRPFELAELQTDLAAIAGQLEIGDGTMRFYYVKTL
jgi:toluene monooxygenase system protein D